MKAPTTPTGKRLFPPERSSNYYRVESDGSTTSLRDHTRADILAIEAEAAAAERERLREKACDHPLVCSHHHLIIPTHLLAEPEDAP